MQFRSLGWEDLLEEEMATHPGILAWKISQTEEPGRQQSIGLPRVRHDWVTKHSTHYCYQHQYYSLYSVHLSLFSGWFIELYLLPQCIYSLNKNNYFIIETTLYKIVLLIYGDNPKYNDDFKIVVMRWMKLEPIIQSEVSQKEKYQYSILMHIYGI